MEIVLTYKTTKLVKRLAEELDMFLEFESHNTACSNHCCNEAGLENPCPERLSKPDLANQMKFC